VLAALAGAAVVTALALVLGRGRESAGAPLAAGFTLLSTAGEPQSQATFSPDGTALAFVARDAAGVDQVWRRELTREGASETAVALTAGTVPVSTPRWGRDGAIVFARRDEGIWSVPASGGEARRIVERGSRPNLSRDGRRLVFERQGEGIWVANADGTDARRVAGIPETWIFAWAYRHPALSPDGSEVVYFQPLAGRFGDFFRISAGGGQPRRLTHDLAEAGTPAWLPDASAVVVSSTRDGARNLWLVPLDGGAPRPMTVGAGDDVSPDVSRDGRFLVYTTVRSTFTVTLRDPASGEDRPIHTRRTTLLWRPALSPRGDRVAFFGGHKPGSVRTFVADLAGATAPLVVPPSAPGFDQIHPTWSADGETLYYYEDYVEAWRVAPDGSGLRLDPTAVAPTYRTIAATGGASRPILDPWWFDVQRWSAPDPDGRAIVYTRYDERGAARETLLRDLASGAETVLPRVLRRASFSPDGTRILGTVPDSEAVHCRRDGGDCVVVGPARTATWSADGQTIFMRREGRPLEDPELASVDVVAVPAEGGTERLLAHLEPLQRDNDEVTVGPDGTIAWIAHRRGNRELWTARLDPRRP
jgi:Tol biopolymer transport system component